MGAGLVGLAWWLRTKNIKIRWYEWLIGIASLLLLVGAVQNYVSSVSEDQQKAANYLLLYFGLPAIILLTLDWQLVIRHKKTA
jgi:hypothetical protein